VLGAWVEQKMVLAGKRFGEVDDQMKVWPSQSEH